MQGRGACLRFNRRRFMTGAGAAAAIMAGPIAAPGLIGVATAQSWRTGNPFSLGVASGAPRPDGFVLWTRLAPEPANPETPGGMSGGDVALRYEIATDPGMAKIVRRGNATAEQAFAYSVHLDVAGLEGGRPIGTASSPATRSARLDARSRFRPPDRRSPSCDLALSPAPTTSTVIFPPTGT